MPRTASGCDLMAQFEGGSPTTRHLACTGGRGQPGRWPLWFSPPGFHRNQGSLGKIRTPLLSEYPGRGFADTGLSTLSAGIYLHSATTEPNSQVTYLHIHIEHQH